MSNRETGKPSLSTLAFILRNRELWPEDFEWEFSSCRKCAMGLAHVMWPSVVKDTCSEAMAIAFGISFRAAHNMFCLRRLPHSLYCEWDTVAVTPEMVADRIDAYLATEAYHHVIW